MKTIYSKVYTSRKIRIGNDDIEFNSKGEATVEDKTAKKVEQSGLPIFMEEIKDIEKKSKSENEILSEEIVASLKEEHRIEVSKLKSVISNREKIIEDLKKEVASWKEIYEKLAFPEKEKIGKEAPEEENELLKELKELNKESLVSLLMEEEENKLTESQLKMKKKDELIDLIISYQK